MTQLRIALTIVLFGLATPAFAYVGPGAGLSLLGALWALLAAIGLALFLVIAWPLRRLMRRRRAAPPRRAPQPQDARRA